MPRSVCPLDCPDTCSMVARVEEGRVVSVAGERGHDFTRGFLCHKVAHYPERTHHPDRLLYPLRRVGSKGEGRFERVSWDAALTGIAARLRTIMDGPDGPQAILPYSYAGTMGRIQGSSLDRRFFHRLGASLLDRTICATAGGAGYTATIGARIGMAPEGFSESRYIINWGSNTAVTNSHLWVRMVEARKAGAKIVTIDPYACRTAERSDWHLRPRVGTDAALALGMMHVIFRDGLEDREYLSRAVLGEAELRERVATEYGLDRVAHITGLPPGDIEQLAWEYAKSAPQAIRINYGLQRHRGGGMAVRTIACLPAVVGAWRHFAGGILLSTSGMFPLDQAALERPDLIPPGTRTINMSSLAEALHGELSGPPVRALVVYNSNPAAVCPDQSRVLSGLRRDDLFTVVLEHFQTDTADYADFVLPATTQFEHFDLHTAYGHHYVQVNEPVIAPLGEALPNTEIFRRLADRMGLERELFETSDEDLARAALWEGSSRRPAELEGITLDTLVQQGPQRLRIPPRHTPFAEGRFPAPSGQCEFLCVRLSLAGVDPLATYIPPAESPESAPELAARYPLQLLTPPSPHFLNSTFVNIDSLRNSAREPEIDLHPEDALSRGVDEGAMVRVFNDRGEFLARARVRDSVRPGVAMSPSIWWNRYSPERHGANATTSSRLTDLGGGATFFDNLVEVAPVEGQAAVARVTHEVI
jgi:anaerobic selenocysteine-containing dehydrogenase